MAGSQDWRTPWHRAGSSIATTFEDESKVFSQSVPKPWSSGVLVDVESSDRRYTNEYSCGGSEADLAASSPLELDDNTICNVYDTYIKKVARNRSRNGKRDYYRRQTHGFSLLPQEMIDSLSRPENYAFSQVGTLEVKGFSCQIRNDMLYSAMRELEPQKLLILILFYWYCWTDAECAKFCNIATRTACKWRHTALSQLQKRMKRGV